MRMNWACFDGREGMGRREGSRADVILEMSDLIEEALSLRNCLM